ncbi:MAG: guanylate kinase [Chitinophagaceae bacterium]|nr:MAG: guanylate kinase [Chitinophagaceae bacterium]
MEFSKGHQLIILTAPSGAGKTTIAHALLKKIPHLGFTISATTRSPRAGEINGKDYYFLNIRDFERKIADNSFIEYEMVYPGKYYGTLYSELERIWDEKKYPLRVVDVLGAVELKKKFTSNALSIFIKPPSLDILYERLKLRGTENEKALQERIKRASMEMGYVSNFDKVVINDNLEKAVQETVEIVKVFCMC